MLKSICKLKNILHLQEQVHTFNIRQNNNCGKLNILFTIDAGKAERLKQNPSKRVSHLQKQLKTPAKTIERWIKKLRDEGKIEYRGSKKNRRLSCQMNLKL